MYAKVLARPPVLNGIDIKSSSILKFLYNRRIRTADDFNWTYRINKLNSPANIFDIENVAKTLLKWLNDSKKIVIYGDYDADGILSTYILYDFLHNILNYKKVWVWLPSRFLDGYGLNNKNLGVISQFADAVITVDCGIKDKKLVEEFKDKLDFIIIDHHTLPDKLPNVPIIHLQYKNKIYFDKVSAGFTVLKFVSFLAKYLNINNIKYIEEHIAKYFEFAAITLVTDVMPMINENRRLLKLTYHTINSIRHQEHTYANVDIAGSFILKFIRFLKNKEAFLNYKDLGFVIGPRLNAVGRVMDPNIAFSSVVAPDNYKFSILDKINTIRRNLVQNWAEDTFEEFFHNKNVILGYSANLSEGIIGLIAGNYSKEHQKVGIFCTNDQDGLIKCSARSPKSISIIDILNKLNDKFNCFHKYGGHTNAAGFTLMPNVDIKTFWAYLTKVVNNRVILQDSYILVDDILTPAKLDVQLVSSFKEFEPFGPGNEEYKIIVWGNLHSIRELKNNQLILTLADFYDSSKLIDAYLFTDELRHINIGSKLFILGTGAITSDGRALFFGQRLVDKIKIILN